MFGGNNDLKMSLTVTGKDETGGLWASATKEVESFAKLLSKPIEVGLRLGQGGLGFLRDINLGLKPLIEGAVRGIDNLIERGGSFELIQKNFAELADSENADKLARGLQVASQNTLQLRDAMRLANEGLTDDVPLRQLPLIFEFAAKKAAALGQTTEGLASALMSGIGRGSPMLLKQFGIDIHEVADNYERIHGLHTFDDLDFATRRSMVLAAATEKMREEMQKLSVTGKESFFSWQGIKNEIGDATDHLMAALVGSEKFRDELGAIRDFIGGIAQHFEGGGSISELLMGKGESGGLFGLGKAALMDFGEWIWEGIKKGWSFMVDELPGKIMEGLKWLESDFIPKFTGALTKWREEAIDALAEWINSSKLGKWLFGEPEPKGGSTGGAIDKTENWFKDLANDSTSWDRFKNRWGWPFAPTSQPSKGAWEMYISPAMIARALGVSALGGVNLQREGAAWNKNFPPRTQGKAAVQGSGLMDFPTGDRPLELTRFGEDEAFREINKIERQIRIEEAQAARDAKRMAGEQARRLRADHFKVTKDDQEDIEREIRERLIKQRTGPLRERVSELGKRIFEPENANPKASTVADKAVAVLNDMKKSVDDFTGYLGQVLEKLTGAERQLDAARAG